MLAGGSDKLYRRILAAGVKPVAWIDVFDGAGNLLDTIQYGQVGKNSSGKMIFMSGSVSATLTNRVTRQFDFTVHETLYPVNDDDLLAPYGNAVKAYLGIEMGDGNTQYTWQVFGGRISRTRLSANGVVTVSCYDRAADVLDNGFTAPFSSSVGIRVDTQMRELISDGYPQATFGPSDSFGQTMPLLTWDSDRGAPLDEMAQTLGAFWYPLANEQFVIRRIPWTIAGSPVVTLSDGDDGIIVDYGVERDRTNVYNVITTTGERADGTTPVYATAVDDNPASPTYSRGNFGRRTRQTHLQTPQTTGSVQSAANDILRSSKALTESWDLSIIPDASLELGDVVDLAVAGRTGITQVISGFVLPIDGSGPMNLNLRSQVAGLLEGDV